MDSRPVVPDGDRSQLLMTRTPVVALAVAALLAAAGAAHSADRAALRYPVVDLKRTTPTGPAYVADRIEIQVARGAAASLSARAVHAVAAARPHLERLGLAEADRVAANLGAWFEPEFAGETPPAEGSGARDFTTFYIVHLPDGADVPAALASFRAASGIASADPIAVLPVSAVPNDSLWSTSYWFDQLSGHDIHAPAAWDVTTGDTSVVVAILDTGILPYHPDLGGTTAGLFGQIWHNWAEQGGTPFVDDDGNGFVDDTWGWDFVANQPVATGEDGRDEDNDPNDFAGHGTLVAGIVGALTDNTIGVTGTAWNVRLMAVRIGWSDFGAPLGLVDMSYVAQGIRYATRNGASVINCSFATLNQSGLYAAVDDAIANGVTIVAASGNGGAPHELADREDVIAVAATDANDVVAGFSNLGSFVDLSAPGVQLTSTFVAHLAPDSIGERQPTYAANMSGTSFAAPQVTGAVALLQAHQKQLGRPPLPPMGALLRLRETADDISAENPGAFGYGTGRLNLFRALTDPPGSRVSRATAATIGPPVVLPGTSGNARLAYATSDRHVVIVDATSGDTLALAALGGTPARQLAAADLGGGRGVGLFVGTTNGKVYGFDANGVALAGWPKSGAGPAYSLDGGPALGDLDGDGVLEVVCGSADGSVFAWHANGATVAGFPVSLDATGVDLPVALAPVDTFPGAEIVAITNGGDVHVLAGDGSEIGGWPQHVTGVPVAPLVTALGLVKKTAVIVSEGTLLHAFAPDGSTVWTATLPGSALQDPAASDLDGDGSDEILVPTFSPAALAVYDSTGTPWTARGFPASLPAVPDGPVVVGPLRPGGKATALLMSGGALMAFTDSAVTLARFPEPGGAGKFPEIAELEADGQSEIAAGSGVDSLLYVYAAGPGTWGTLASSWPAVRANDARTGSRLYAPAIPPRDDIPPAAILNLAAKWAPTDSVALTWTAPGDNGLTGRAASYELRVTADSASATNFALGSRTDLPAPDTSGTLEHFTFQTGAIGTRLFMVLRAHDAAGNVASPSNVAALTTPGAPSLVVTSLAIAALGDSTVSLKWSAPPGSWKYDLRYGPAPLDTVTFGAAANRRDVLASGAATDTVTIRSLEPGTTWWFALRTIGLTGGQGPISNTVKASVPVGGALRGRVGIALAARGNPARVPAVFDWQGGGAGVIPEITIYDLSGRKVRRIPLPGGRFGGSVQWNGRDDDQRAVPAGLYFARLACGSFHAQARVVLLP